MSYTFVHEGVGYTPDGATGATTKAEANRRNRAMSREEVEQFIADHPERVFACHKSRNGDRTRVHTGDEVATWVGDRLAVVVWSGEPYSSGFGPFGGMGRRQSFRALGIDGGVYSGTAYLSNGDYVRMRRIRTRVEGS
jgi:hypothetical protein